MTLLRKLIDIPTSVGDADFVVRASEGADLAVDRPGPPTAEAFPHVR
jgi:hypothetical protein